MIRVGVDAWNLPGDHRGIGRYVRALLRCWSERFRERIDVTLIVPEWDTWRVAGRYRREVDRPYRIVSRRLHRRARLDALWFPFNGCSWLEFALPAVATLHDASSFVLPGRSSEDQSIFRNAQVRCCSLVTDSNFSRAELSRELAVPPERLTVIPLGVAAPLPQREDAMVSRLEPFVLYVGPIAQHKGSDLLLGAMALVQQRFPEMTLVVAGEANRRAASDAGLRMRLLGYVDDVRLAALYRSCTLFAFPSRYEGFGLPILEAMSYGAPVVTSRTSACPEAAGDAAYYVPSNDAGVLAQAIMEIIEDRAYAEDLRRRGFARAAAMTWERTAAATLGVLEQALR